MSADDDVMIERAEELLYLLQELTRHLSKHDVLENAGFFEYGPTASRRGKWNNDTVVYLLELIIRDWFAQRFPSLPFQFYVQPGKGLVPPIERTVNYVLGVYPDPDQELDEDEEH